MNAIPIILESINDGGRRLARIEATPGDPKDENWLQEVLYRHPESLPVEEFDDMFAPAIPIGREVPTGRGPLDNLYVSPSGGLTIVETKLWKNPEKHRTVVAQIIEYATQLAAWGYDDLCKAILASSRNRKEPDCPGLEEKVKPALQSNSISLAAFQESVETNLREGNFLLLIVGDRISPHITLLTDAIHSAPGLGFHLGLVEMRLHPLVAGKDWPLIVVPDVVGRTVEKLRGIVRVRYTQEKPDVSVDIGEDPPGHTGRIDLDMFLEELPRDLVQPYREAVEKWENIGGTLDLTNKMIHFAMELNGEHRRVIRCRTFQATLVTRKMFADWSKDASLYERYLEQVDESAVVGNLARSDKQWVSYRKISPDDLRVLLNAGMSLAKDIAEAEDAASH